MGNVQEQLMAFVCFVILCGCLWLFAMMILAVFFKRNEACEPEKINSPDYPPEVDIIQAEIANLKKRQESGTLGGGVGSLYRDSPMPKEMPVDFILDPYSRYPSIVARFGGKKYCFLPTYSGELREYSSVLADDTISNETKRQVFAKVMKLIEQGLYHE